MAKAIRLGDSGRLAVSLSPLVSGEIPGDAFDRHQRYGTQNLLSRANLHGWHRSRPSRLQQQSAAATDLLNVVVSVHDSFRRPAATLSERGSGSLQAEGSAAL